MQFSYPIIYDIKSLWQKFTEDRGLFSNLVDTIEIVSFGIAYYAIIMCIILLFKKSIPLIIHGLVFIFTTLVFSYFDSIYELEQQFMNLGLFSGIERLTNTNIAALKYLILLPFTTVLLILSILKKTRSFDRIIISSFGLFVAATTIVFHIFYFHIIQAAHLQSHEIHLKTAINNFELSCKQGHFNCFSGKDMKQLEIPDYWVESFVKQELGNNRNKNEFVILKTTNNFDGPRVGYFKTDNNSWKVIIENRSSTTFGKSMELAFWLQMGAAHIIWLIGAWYIILRHKKMFQRFRKETK